MKLISCLVSILLIAVASATYPPKYRDPKKYEKKGYKKLEEKELFNKIQKSDIFEKFAEAGGTADAFSENFNDDYKKRSFYKKKDKQLRETFTMVDADKSKLSSSFLGGAIAEGGDSGEVAVSGTSLAGITDTKTDKKESGKFYLYKKVPDTYVEYKKAPMRKYKPMPYSDYKPLPYDDYKPMPYPDYKPYPYPDYKPMPYPDYKPVPYDDYKMYEKPYKKYEDYKPYEYNMEKPYEQYPYPYPYPMEPYPYPYPMDPYPMDYKKKDYKKKDYEPYYYPYEYDNGYTKKQYP